MSKSQKSRQSLCGNCKHFVVGGLCELVKGQIKAKDTCDLHEYGKPQTIDTQVDPTHNKLDVNYKPGFMVETTGDIVQKAIQMEHELLLRGIPENEVHRAVVEYFSQREPPFAMPWPGPVTGLDLAAPINNVTVPDTGTPLTNFDGLPQNTEPYPTPNKSPYGIGTTSQPYPSFFSPDPNSLGSLSNTYDVLNPPYPGDLTNWGATSSQLNSEPSMHGEHGFNVEKSIPEWRYPIEDSQMYPLQIPDVNIPPSGTNRLAEAEKKKKDWKSILAKWAALLGGAAAVDSILKNYLDSGVNGEPPTQPLQVFAEYQYHGHDSDDECYPYNGKTFDLLETHNRPVIPSENLGYTTSHPNCKCTWKIIQNYSKPPDSISRKEESEIHSIESHISKAAKDGTLHKVKKDGKLSKKTTSENPLKESTCCQKLKLPNINLKLPKTKAKAGSFWLQKVTFKEALTNLRSEFKWINDEYISKAKELAESNHGILYLIRAARESITDHRSEGEPYRRKLAADELYAMSRTGITKGMDINHQPEFRTDATILDAEFDPIRKEIQMLVMERDPQINQAISNGIITAVSINGGMPRSESVESCNHGCTDETCELCVVPRGVVLGELDDIAMTWVVTDPNGMYWNGKFIPSAEPGIKVTKIETL